MPGPTALRLVVEGMISKTGAEFIRALSYGQNPNWIWLTAFVGRSLLQSSVASFRSSELAPRTLRGKTAAGT